MHQSHWFFFSGSVTIQRIVNIWLSLTVSQEMPLSQARGEIINYIVTLRLKNGTEVKQVTRQRRDTESQQLAEQSCRQLRHFPLKPGVMGVFVSANTSMGTSDPTYMLFAERGKSMQNSDEMLQS